MNKTKITIDSEIKQLSGSLNGLIDTLPTYVPKELKELRDITLNIHRLLETAMESRIIYGVDKSYGIKTSSMNLPARALRLLSLEPILSNLSFNQKVRIIKFYNDSENNLVETLEKANSYRNEFVHPNEYKLKRKFDVNTPKGKQNVRDLLRCLSKAIKEFNLYFKNYIK